MSPQPINLILKENRPKISPSSINTYTSILNNLFKKIEGGGVPTLEWFLENTKKIIEFLNPMKPELRKLRLSALVVLTDKHPKISEIYRSQMIDDIQHYNSLIREQKKSESQNDAWISQNEVQRIHEELKNQVLYLMRKPEWTKQEREMYQNYLILSLYVLNPPRRLEYIDMKLNHIPNKEEEKKGNIDYNYIKARKFYFCKYKTSQKYGEQVVNINPRLYTIIRKWKMMNPRQEWLLSSYDGKKLTAPQITQRLNKIFGKKISVNMLRHIFITENVLKNLPALRELDETAREMGHSTETAMLYKKID